MPIEIKYAVTPAEVRQFVRFPVTLYKNESRWSPPLWDDEYKTYKPKYNPVLQESEYVLMLAFRDGVLVGRNMVYVNHMFNAHFRVRYGLFGAYEAIDDAEVSKALFDAAESWLEQHDVTAIRGPIHPVAELWGFLVEGNETPGVFLTPWNLQYYDTQTKAAGYQKIKDLVAYEIDATNGFELHPRYTEFYDHFMKRHPDVTIRPIDMNNIESEAENIWRLSNISLIDNWGFLPVSRPLLLDMVGRLKPIADPAAIWFVEKQGKPVAFVIGYPDLNLILRETKGRLFPFGWYRILTEPRKLKQYRLFGLAVDPKYHGMGFDALMYVHLAKALAPKRIKLEANWVLEDNAKMTNALDRLDMKLTRRYRVYQKELKKEKSPAPKSRT